MGTLNNTIVVQNADFEIVEALETDRVAVNNQPPDITATQGQGQTRPCQGHFIKSTGSQFSGEALDSQLWEPGFKSWSRWSRNLLNCSRA